MLLESDKLIFQDLTLIFLLLQCTFYKNVGFRDFALPDLPGFCKKSRRET